MKISAAVAADVAAVLALDRACREAPHWPEAEYHAIVAGRTGPVRRCLLVALEGDELLGFAAGSTVTVNADAEAELETVAVRPLSRRHGIGRELCSAMVEWACAQGASVVNLEVRQSSAGAIALYTALGFALVGRRRQYYSRPDEDAVLMRMERI